MDATRQTAAGVDLPALPFEPREPLEDLEPPDLREPLIIVEGRG